LQRIAKRLEPYKEQVIKEAREKGSYQALCLARKLADVRSLDRFETWLKEVTHDENICIRPPAAINPDRDPVFKRQKLHQAFGRLVGNYELIAKLRDENEQLRAELKEELGQLLEINRERLNVSLLTWEGV